MTGGATDGAGPDRHIAFECVVNFRDLGGYRAADGRTLRWRRLFRSGGLQHMSEADVARARALGIATVLDLRRPDEVRELGTGPLDGSLDGPPVRRHWLPLVPEGGSALLDERHGRGISGERYLGYLGFGGEHFVSALELIADRSTHPALFHCAAGKDRTGVIAALVLDILGVETETIVEDYALSNAAAEALLEQARRDHALRSRRGHAAEGAPPASPPADWRPAPPEAMRAFLDGVRRDYGSSRGYFESLGVAAATFERLAEALLE